MEYYKSTCTLYWNLDYCTVSDDECDVAGLTLGDEYNFKRAGTRFYLEKEDDKYKMIACRSKVYVLFDSKEKAENSGWFVRI